MFKKNMFLLAFITIFTGCDSDNNSDSNSNNDIPLSENVLTSDITTSTETVMSQVLLDSNQPLLGFNAPKSITWYSNLSEFEGKWMDFTTDTIPTIDFSSHNVVLFDLGGERDIDSCGNKYRFDTAESELQTTTFTGDNGEAATRKTTVLTLNTTQCLSTKICTDNLTPARPFVFISVPTKGEVILKENESFSYCK